MKSTVYIDLKGIPSKRLNSTKSFLKNILLKTRNAYRNLRPSSRFLIDITKISERKKTLYKFIPLIAPYGNAYKKYLPLLKKYDIDSMEVKENIADWKKNLDKRLVDSFSVAMIRDQEKRHIDTAVQAKNVRKNAELLLWTFKNYGFLQYKR